MQGMIISGIAVFISFWNYNFFDNKMVQKLYKMEKQDAEKKVFRNVSERSDFLFQSFMYNQKEWFIDTLPACLCKCYKPNRKEKTFQLARVAMQKEINIIEILKSRRYVNAAIKSLLPRNQRKKLKERSRYIVINPEKEADKESKADPK